ncbi:MAG: molecular chaperone HtpG [Clostridia bacterium]|nr:molecular chaperone HtpG [Clostridia bacterium]
MRKKQFKTESQKLLDMMINSIYTNKEIFLREIISNASDAIDKLYYRSLTDDSVTLKRSDYKIDIKINKDKGQIVISDNGCGMTKDELENNLGTIAKSGSFEFKKENTEQKDVDIIGQFGVGFYSSFMVCKKVSVLSLAYGSDTAYRWESEGVDGYTVEEAEKATNGTEITLTLKDDEGEEKYSEYLSEYRIRALIKKYSDYISYPIKMDVTHQRLKEGSTDEYEDYVENETLNSQKPLWKKSQSEVTEEEYAGFYKDKYYDFEAPLKVISQKSEGLTSFEALLFIPAHAPFDYYSKTFEKGLELYSSGVMITEKCKELLPDYFSFVRGVVDSADLTLNISRETLQHDRQLKVIAKAIEKKIKNELAKMQENDREKYEKFWAAFGAQIKYGMYEGYGANKENLKDLIMFVSSKERKLVSFKEYIANMKDGQKEIYYACGETADKILMLPQVEAVVEKGYEILLLTEDVDEFAIKMLGDYEEKSFKNVCADALDLTSDEEKATKETENEKNKEMLDYMKEAIKDVSSVKLTNDLGSHPVSLSTQGEMSIEMEKVLSKMPGADKSMIKAQTVLEINMNHEILSKLKLLFINDKEKLGKYAKILYAQARLINGLDIENPSEYAQLVCELM